MTITQMIEEAKKAPSRALTERESKQLLAAYGAPVVAEAVVHDIGQAVWEAGRMGFPVVLKGLGRELLHKTELGVVHLNLADDAAVHSAYDAIHAAGGSRVEGVLVQPMIKGQRELVAGLFRDEQFGPVVMFGVGGIFAEALSDVAFRLAPLTESDAEDMIGDIRAKTLMGAFRGDAPADRSGIIRILMGLSRIARDYPEVAEIDVNPLKVTPEGRVIAVDALVTVREVPPEKTFLPAVDPVRLGKFFHPRSVAFVGASAAFGKWGHTLLAITLARGYKGEVYLVNPKGGMIAGKPVFPSVADIPGAVDLAVVTIPAEGVMDLIPQFQAKGIRNMLLITSGFAETGEAGRRLEESLIARAREADILIVGPNTMGICNPHIRFYCTGSHVWPEPGDTAVVTQSGNMGTQLLAFAEQHGIGIRGFSGSGNEGMVTIEDYLEAFATDPTTRNVVLYIESVKNGRRFFEVARRTSRIKPIVLMKGGRTAAGSRAAASHTGALASDARIFNAVCKQAGIVTARYPTDLLDLSAAFSSLPLPKGNRAAIMTLGGGWGVVTADLCAEFGIEVPELSSDIIDRIDRILPPYWSKSNPVDIVGEHDPAIAVNVLKELMAWNGCDAVINLGLMGRRVLLGRIVDSVLKANTGYSAEFTDALKKSLTDFEAHYVRLAVSLMEKHQKPIFGVSIAFEQEEKTVYPVEGALHKAVFYPTPEKAVRSFAKMVEYHQYLSR